jgi:methyl-accepting chemotaxis protein
MKIKWQIIISSIVLILLFSIFNSFLFQKNIESLMNSQTTKELENYSYLLTKELNDEYPGDWSEKDGNLYKGNTLMNENYTIIDNFTNNTKVLATVFSGDTRVSTSLVNGERPINTKALPTISDTVLGKGETYNGSSNIEGRSAQTNYTPIKDSSGKIIGMLSVGINTTTINDQISHFMKSIYIGSTIFLLIIVVIFYILGNFLSKGISKVSTHVKTMAEGDFSVVFEPSLLKRKDEVGEIANSILHMQEQIVQTIYGIQNECMNVAAAASVSAEKSVSIYGEMEDVSATTEELSAGMEETAAATEEMNSSSALIVDDIVKINDEIVLGSDLVKEIRGRAGVLKTEAVKSQSEAFTMFKETQSQLKDSIEKVSLINEIQNLSKMVMQIAFVN